MKMEENKTYVYSSQICMKCNSVFVYYDGWHCNCETTESLQKIINDTLRALPVGNINTHTPDTIPERVQDWVKEAAEECRLREKWEEIADNLIPYAEDYARYLEEGIYKNNPFSNHQNYQAVSKVIEQYEKLKK